MRKVIGFDDVSCGQFFIWLFNFAEEQDDEDFAEIHKFYDWLAPLFLEHLNPYINDRDAYKYYSDL